MFWNKWIARESDRTVIPDCNISVNWSPIWYRLAKTIGITFALVKRRVELSKWGYAEILLNRPG
ncbi:unnamed protein product [Fusarium venenatum]|uniref:Uncharacterized protein n=1 Tax=Fusarium venenatum TaxID=56646 RepID=A0A2L2SYJ7_9HYPO|nr:uncharacterized protein FVRRES_04379 [Fusarium venenatum]CEI59943.1 unnamed protein product [Fusarium venenatum]